MTSQTLEIFNFPQDTGDVEDVDEDCNPEEEVVESDGDSVEDAMERGTFPSTPSHRAYQEC